MKPPCHAVGEKHTMMQGVERGDFTIGKVQEPPGTYIYTHVYIYTYI